MQSSGMMLLYNKDSPFSLRLATCWFGRDFEVTKPTLSILSKARALSCWSFLSFLFSPLYDFHDYSYWKTSDCNSNEDIN
jgi:hypothetical protein